MSQIVDPKSPTGRTAIVRCIDHLQHEIDESMAQIESGKYPLYDDNCRKYIKECRTQIKRYMSMAGIEP